MADDDAQQGQVQVRDPARETCTDERGGRQRRPAPAVGFQVAACAGRARSTRRGRSTDIASKKSPAARITRRAGGIISDTCEESGPGQRLRSPAVFSVRSVRSPARPCSLSPSAAFPPRVLRPAGPGEYLHHETAGARKVSGRHLPPPRMRSSPQHVASHQRRIVCCRVCLRLFRCTAVD